MNIQRTGVNNGKCVGFTGVWAPKPFENTIRANVRCNGTSLIIKARLSTTTPFNVLKSLIQNGILIDIDILLSHIKNLHNFLSI